MRWLAILLIVAAVYLLLLGAIWRYQERVVWQPPRLPAWPDGAGARRLEYVAEDGQPLFAYLVGDPASAPGLLIAFHGNADLAGWFVPWAQEAARRTGWAVLVPEYRGYAGLPGRTTYEGSRRDAMATHALALGLLDGAERPVALYGHSLGSAIATELAARLAHAGHPPAALLLESPLTSTRAMARRMAVLPIVPLWNVIARVHFDTRALVARLDVPVSVAHGERDWLIPPSMGRVVFAAARRPGELLLVPGAAHNDVAEIGAERYWGWLARALPPAGVVTRRE